MINFIKPPKFIGKDINGRRIKIVDDSDVSSSSGRRRSRSRSDSRSRSRSRHRSRSRFLIINFTN
jgi:hypothetical protein